MKQRRRIYYSASQRALIWERWRKGVLSTFLFHAERAVGVDADAKGAPFGLLFGTVGRP